MFRATGIPSILMTSISRQVVASAQERLAQAQVEVSTGRHHDVGLALGVETGRSVALRLERASIERSGEMAEQSAAEADATQLVLKNVSQLSLSFLETLAGARGAVLGQELARDAATAALGSFTELLNTTFNGKHLFAGLNSDQQALRAYDQNTPSAAVNAAFLNAFGVVQGDPAVNLISANDMRTFLDGSFSSEFSSPAWQTNWSNASDANILVRLGSSQQVDASANANAEFVSMFAQAFTSIMALGQGDLNQAAFEATVDHAIALIGKAQLELNIEQSRIGIAQNRISSIIDSSSERELQLSKAIQQLESVDAYDAATKVNLLLTQLETSYTLTGRISRMSLLSYI